MVVVALSESRFDITLNFEAFRNCYLVVHKHLRLEWIVNQMHHIVAFERHSIWSFLHKFMVVNEEFLFVPCNNHSDRIEVCAGIFFEQGHFAFPSAHKVNILIVSGESGCQWLIFLQKVSLHLIRYAE